MTDYPSLIEPGMKFFMHNSLKECRHFREKRNYYIFNVSVFGILLAITSAVLYYRYKGKLTPYQQQQKLHQQHYYVLSRIKQMQDINQQQRNELVTNLPKWNAEINAVFK